MIVVVCVSIVGESGTCIAWRCSVCGRLGVFPGFCLTICRMGTATPTGTYFLLNAENYHWQWTAFQTAASTSIYVFLYSVSPTSHAYCVLLVILLSCSRLCIWCIMREMADRTMGSHVCRYTTSIRRRRCAHVSCAITGMMSPVSTAWSCPHVMQHACDISLTRV